MTVSLACSARYLVVTGDQRRIKPWGCGRTARERAPSEKKGGPGDGAPANMSISGGAGGHEAGRRAGEEADVRERKSGAEAARERNARARKRGRVSMASRGLCGSLAFPSAWG